MVLAFLTQKRRILEQTIRPLISLEGKGGYQRATHWLSKHYAAVLWRVEVYSRQGFRRFRSFSFWVQDSCYIQWPVNDVVTLHCKGVSSEPRLAKRSLLCTWVSQGGRLAHRCTASTVLGTPKFQPALLSFIRNEQASHLPRNAVDVTGIQDEDLRNIHEWYLVLLIGPRWPHGSVWARKHDWQKKAINWICTLSLEIASKGHIQSRMIIAWWLTSSRRKIRLTIFTSSVEIKHGST